MFIVKLRRLAVYAALLALGSEAFAAATIQTNEVTITVDAGKVVHMMRGGIGASWHAIGPTVYYYPDLIGRDNRTCLGSAFGGNPPLRPEYEPAWRDLLQHARWLGLDFIRVEISMRMYNPQRGEFTWDNAEMQTLDRILQYCQSNHVDVYFTMMSQDVDWNAHPGVCRLQSEPRSVADFAESYATLLARLVKTNGFTCIHWVTVNNEPGMSSGWWQQADKKPGSIMPAVRALRAALDQHGLKEVAVCGSDGHSLKSGQFEPQDSAVGALSVHNYGGNVPLSLYRECVKAARDRGVPFFVAEFGHWFMGTFEGEKVSMNGPQSEAPKSYDAQMLNAEKVLVGLNEGVDGFNRWSFVNRGDLDGQWQMVRTWNPNLWDYYKEVTPEPVPYFSYGILTRFAAKHSTVLATSSDDSEIVATALRSPKGQTTIYLLNKSAQERKVTLKLAGVTESLVFRRYQVTEAEVTKSAFTLTPLAMLDMSPANNRITAILPGKSIVAYTTFQLADDADGITQE